MRSRGRVVRRVVGAVGLVAAVVASGLVGATTPAAAGTPWFGELTGPSISVTDAYLPVVGRFGDEYVDDIIWYRPGTGVDHLWKATGGTPTFERAPLVPQVAGDYQPFVGDFAGDDHDDIFWYQPGPGADYLWTRTAPYTFSTRTIAISGTYTPHVLTAFGKDDIVWSNPSGADGLWIFPDSGTGEPAKSALTLPPGQILVGRFDTDADDDLFFYQPGPGAEMMWRRNLGDDAIFVLAPQAAINGTYQPVVGSFDDHTSPDDILWFGSGAAQDHLWRGGATFTKTTMNLGPAGTPITVDDKYESFVFVRGTTSDSILHVDDAGPGLLAVPTGNTHPSNAAVALQGSFAYEFTDNLLWYTRGTTPELLFT